MVHQVNDLLFSGQYCRLVTGVLQFADGTHLTIDETQLQSGTLNSTGVENTRLLKNLLDLQKVHSIMLLFTNAISLCFQLDSASPIFILTIATPKCWPLLRFLVGGIRLHLLQNGDGNWRPTANSFWGKIKHTTSRYSVAIPSNFSKFLWRSRDQCAEWLALVLGYNEIIVTYHCPRNAEGMN